MTSPRTLKTVYPFIKHVPASLAKAKAPTAAVREPAGQEQQDSTEKNVGRSSACSICMERKTVGYQCQVVSGITHDQRRG